jgi:hypothetical protein
MHRLSGLLTVALATLLGSASTAAAQVTFQGTALVCFQFVAGPCDPDPSTLGGFGPAWTQSGAGGTELQFRGAAFDVTTDPGTGRADVTFGDAQWFGNGFSGTFYLALLFSGSPAQATPLVFAGTVSTLNDLLTVNFTPNNLQGTYGPQASAFVARVDDLDVSLGLPTPTLMRGSIQLREFGTPVPEPSTALLLVAGLLMTSIARRPQRRGNA